MKRYELGKKGVNFKSIEQFTTAIIVGTIVLVAIIWAIPIIQKQRTAQNIEKQITMFLAQKPDLQKKIKILKAALMRNIIMFGKKRI